MRKLIEWIKNKYYRFKLKRRMKTPDNKDPFIYK